MPSLCFVTTAAVCVAGMFEMQPYKGNELAPVAVTPPLPVESGTALVPNNTELVPGFPTVL